jgi:hypothetical protein
LSGDDQGESGQFGGHYFENSVGRGVYQTQRAEEENLTQINGQLYQLTLILNQTQQEFRQHNLASQRLPGAGSPGMGPVMVNGVPVEDDVA